MLTYPVVACPPVLAAALAPAAPVVLPQLPVRASLPTSTVVRLSCLLLLSGCAAQLGLATLVLLLLGSAVLYGFWAWRQARRRFCQAQAAYPAAFAHYLAQLPTYSGGQPGPAPAAPSPRLPVLPAAVPFERVPPGAYVPPPGYSEVFFAHHLTQNFGPEHIFTQCRVPRWGASSGGAAWYYPDFVYADATGLRIDIEVDEPYVWATGEPHHYLGQDEARNASFLRQQWLVLRFSEEQVARYPVACCQLLAALIHQVSGQHYPLRLYGDRLPAQPRWNWAQAQQLTACRSRAVYQANLHVPTEAAEEE